MRLNSAIFCLYFWNIIRPRKKKMLEISEWRQKRRLLTLVPYPVEVRVGRESGNLFGVRDWGHVGCRAFGMVWWEEERLSSESEGFPLVDCGWWGVGSFSPGEKRLESPFITWWRLVQERDDNFKDIAVGKGNKSYRTGAGAFHWQLKTNSS